MSSFELSADRVARNEKWTRRKAKHRDDYNHSKSGYASGSTRYSEDRNAGKRERQPAYA